MCIVAVSFMQVQAEPYGVYGFYLAKRLPIGTLEPFVEPVGDDVFSAERLGLEQASTSLFAVSLETLTGEIIGVIPESDISAGRRAAAFRYYSESPLAPDMFDKSVLSRATDSTSVDYYIIGGITDITIKGAGKSYPDIDVSVKAALAVYDTHTGEYAFVKNYERTSKDLVEFPRYRKLLKAASGLSGSDRSFARSEPGRVILGIFNDFANDFTSEAVSAVLTGKAASVEEAEKQSTRRTDIPEVIVECADIGQALIAAAADSDAALYSFICDDEETAFPFPAKSSGMLSETVSDITSLTAADFDDDGVDELVVAFGAVSGTMSVFKTGQYLPVSAQPEATIAFNNAVSAVAAGDFDGDGARELAIAHGSDVSVYDTHNGKIVTREPLFTYSGLMDSNDISLASGDFDGNGVDDLAIAAHDSDQGIVIMAMPSYKNDLRRPVKIGQLMSGAVKNNSSGYSIAAADFDLDASDELVIMPSVNPSQIIVAGVFDKVIEIEDPFATVAIPDGLAGIMAVFTHDIDGDRADEIIITSGGNPGQLWVRKYSRRKFAPVSKSTEPLSIDTAGTHDVIITGGVFK